MIKININYGVSYHIIKFKIKNQLERGETKITILLRGKLDQLK